MLLGYWGPRKYAVLGGIVFGIVPYDIGKEYRRLWAIGGSLADELGKPQA
jgi:hypothetical protein